MFLLGICFFFLLWQDRRERLPGRKECHIPFTGRQTAVGEIYYRETGSEHIILYIKNVHLTNAPASGGPKRLLIYADKDSVTSFTALYQSSSDQRSGQLSIGSVIQAEGKIKYMEHETNPGQFDERTFYRARGILWKQYADTVQIVGHAGGVGNRFLEELALFRENACGRLKLLFDPDTAGLLQAMLFGVKNNLPADLSAGFSRMGTSHLLSISGMHFTLLMGSLYRILRKLAVPVLPETVRRKGKILDQEKINRLRRWGCLFPVFVVIFSYMQMLGIRVSALRAGGMLVLLLLSEGLGRSYDRVTAWGAAGMAVLLVQPWSLLTSGFWLSFGAAGAVIAALEWQEERGRREKEAEIREQTGSLAKNGKGSRGGSFGMPLFIQLALLPLQLWFFYEVPVYGLLWNVLLVPLAGLLLGSGALALLGFGLLRFTGSFGKAMGIFLGGPAAAVSGIYQLACQLQQRLPGGVYVCGKPALWQVVFYYSAFLGGLLAGNHCFACEKHRKRRLEGCLFVYMAAFLCLLFYRNRPPWQVAFLDVGQGDCAVLQEENGKTVVIDCGSSDEKGVGTYRLLPYLKYRGVQRVDAVFVSHADEDHISGIRELLEQAELPVGHLICYAAAGEKMEPLLKLAAEREVPVLGMAAGNAVHIGRMQMTCMAPGKEEQASDENNRSLVLLAEQEGVRVLFTGDMGEAEEERLLERICGEPRRTQAEQGKAYGPGVMAAHVLKVGHHGSATSTSAPFLQAVSPALAVISCGENNRYGHPAPETTDRLSQADIRVYETPKTGAVLLQIKKGKIYVNSWRK